MKKMQNHPHLINNFTFLDEVPEEFLYLDIDVSNKNIQYKDIKSINKKLNEKLWSKVGYFKQYLEEVSND